MRSLHIILFSPEPATLPIAYNELLQGVLYSCWRSRYPEVHDEGYGGIRSFRPFTFGRLQGNVNTSSKQRTIQIKGVASFEVRSPIEELLDELAVQLSERGRVRIGAHDLQLCNLKCGDRLLFPKRALVRLSTPTVIYKMLDDGHTQYYSPLDDNWLGMVQANARRKAASMNLPCSPELQAIPLEQSLRKQVTRFKGTYVTGWTGEIILAAEPPLMAALWCLGLGVKNSQGFGMFEIDDRPL